MSNKPRTIGEMVADAGRRYGIAAKTNQQKVENIRVGLTGQISQPVRTEDNIPYIPVETAEKAIDHNPIVLTEAEKNPIVYNLNRYIVNPAKDAILTSAGEGVAAIINTGYDIQEDIKNLTSVESPEDLFRRQFDTTRRDRVRSETIDFFRNTVGDMDEVKQAEKEGISSQERHFNEKLAAAENAGQGEWEKHTNQIKVWLDNPQMAVQRGVGELAKQATLMILTRGKLGVAGSTAASTYIDYTNDQAEENGGIYTTKDQLIGTGVAIGSGALAGATAKISPVSVDNVLNKVAGGKGVDLWRAGQSSSVGKLLAGAGGAMVVEPTSEVAQELLGQGAKNLSNGKPLTHKFGTVAAETLAVSAGAQATVSAPSVISNATSGALKGVKRIQETLTPEDNANKVVKNFAIALDAANSDDPNTRAEARKRMQEQRELAENKIRELDTQIATETNEKKKAKLQKQRDAYYTGTIKRLAELNDIYVNSLSPEEVWQEVEDVIRSAGETLNQLKATHVWVSNPEIPQYTGTVGGGNTSAVIRMGDYSKTGENDRGRGDGNHLDIHLSGNLKGKDPSPYLDRFLVADGKHQGKTLKNLLDSKIYVPASGQVYGAPRKGRSHKGIDFDSRIGSGVVINPKYQVSQVTTHHDPGGYGNYLKVHFSDGVVIGLGHMGKANVDAFMQTYNSGGMVQQQQAQAAAVTKPTASGQQYVADYMNNGDGKGDYHAAAAKAGIYHYRFAQADKGELGTLQNQGFKLAGRAGSGGEGALAHKDAIQPLKDMFAAMQAAKIQPPMIISAYRSYATQATMKGGKKGATAKDWKTSAPAGYSEHSTGLVFDFSVDGNLNNSFAKTEQYKWLTANAAKYGFVLSFDETSSRKTGVEYESWHWKYVGTARAKALTTPIGAGGSVNTSPTTQQPVQQQRVQANSSNNKAVEIVSAGEGKPTVLKLADGTVVSRTGTRAWRNNNPGNLEYRDFAKRYGAIGSDGRYAIFPTKEMGDRARAALIFEGENYKNITLTEAIRRYAPKVENNTAGYQKTVLAAVGNQNKKMSEYTASERTAILAAMEKVEGNKAGKEEIITAGSGYVTESSKQPSNQDYAQSALDKLLSDMETDEFRAKTEKEQAALRAEIDSLKAQLAEQNQNQEQNPEQQPTDETATATPIEQQINKEVQDETFKHVLRFAHVLDDTHLTRLVGAGAISEEHLAQLRELSAAKRMLTEMRDTDAVRKTVFDGHSAKTLEESDRGLNTYILALETAMSSDRTGLAKKLLPDLDRWYQSHGTKALAAARAMQMYLETGEPVHIARKKGSQEWDVYAGNVDTATHNRTGALNIEDTPYSIQLVNSIQNEAKAIAQVHKAYTTALGVSDVTTQIDLSGLQDFSEPIQPSLDNMYADMNPTRGTPAPVNVERSAPVDINMINAMATDAKRENRNLPDPVDSKPVTTATSPTPSVSVNTAPTSTGLVRGHFNSVTDFNTAREKGQINPNAVWISRGKVGESQISLSNFLQSGNTKVDTNSENKKTNVNNLMETIELNGESVTRIKAGILASPVQVKDVSKVPKLPQQDRYLVVHDGTEEGKLSANVEAANRYMDMLRVSVANNSNMAKALAEMAMNPDTEFYSKPLNVSNNFTESKILEQVLPAIRNTLDNLPPMKVDSAQFQNVVSQALTNMGTMMADGLFHSEIPREILNGVKEYPKKTRYPIVVHSNETLQQWQPTPLDSNQEQEVELQTVPEQLTGDNTPPIPTPATTPTPVGQEASVPTEVPTQVPEAIQDTTEATAKPAVTTRNSKVATKTKNNTKQAIATGLNKEAVQSAKASKQVTETEQEVDTVPTEYIKDIPIPKARVNQAVGVQELVSDMVNHKSETKPAKETEEARGVIEAVAQYNPHFKVQIQDKDSYADESTKTDSNTIYVDESNPELLQEIAKQLVTKSVAHIADEIDNLTTEDMASFKETEDKLASGELVYEKDSKDAHDHERKQKLMSLRQDLSEIAKTVDMSVGQLLRDKPEIKKEYPDVIARLSLATSSHSNLINMGIFDEDTKAILKLIKMERKNTWTTVYENLVDIISRFFGKEPKQHTAYSRLIDAIADASVINAGDYTAAFKQSNTAKIRAFRDADKDTPMTEMKKLLFPVKGKTADVRHALQAHFKQESSLKRPLSSIPNFVMNLSQDINAATEALGFDKKPTEAQEKQVMDFVTFNQLFTSYLEQAIKVKYNKDYLYQSKANYFIEEDVNGNVTIEPNVASALSYAAYDYMMAKGNHLRNTDKEIFGLLGIYEEELQDALYLPKEVREAYQYRGVSALALANSLGKRVAQTLNIKRSSFGSDKMESDLHSALGNWVITAMQGADLIHIQEMPMAEHEANIAKLDMNPDDQKALLEESQQTTKANSAFSVARFVSFTDEKGEGRNDLLDEIVELNKGTGSFLADIMGGVSMVRYPLLKAPNPDNVKTKIKRTISKVSKVQAERVSKAQQESMVIEEDFFALVTGLEAEHPSGFHQIIGSQVTEEQLEAAHDRDHAGMLGKAESVRRDWENAVSWITSIPAVNGVREFWDTMYMATNSRMHLNATVMNIQGSKLHRAMADLKNFKVSIKIKQRGESTLESMVAKIKAKGRDIKAEDLTNEELKLMFYIRAMGENAEGSKGFIEKWIKDNDYDWMFKTGFTVDKLPSYIFIPAFLEYMGQDYIQDAMKAITKKMDGEKLTAAEMEKIIIAVADMGMEASSLRALMEMAKFHNATESKDGTVSLTTSFGLGSDGLNNGAALAHIWNGAFDEQLLDRTGFYVTSSKYRSYFDARHDFSVGDYYTGFVGVVGTALDPDISTGYPQKIEARISRLQQQLSEKEDPDKENEIEQLQIVLKNIQSIKGIHTSLEKRDVAKAMLVPFNYGAGMKGLGRSVFNRFMDDIQSIMVKAANKDREVYQRYLGGEFTKEEYNVIRESIIYDKGKEGKDPSIAELMDIIQELTGQETVSLVVENDPTTDGEKYEVKFDASINPRVLLHAWFDKKTEAQLQKAYDNSAGAAVIDALSEYESDYIEAKKVNMDLLQANIALFTEVYKQVEEKAIQKVIARDKQYWKDQGFSDTEAENIAEKEMKIVGLTDKDREELVHSIMDKLQAKVHTLYSAESNDPNAMIQLTEVDSILKGDTDGISENEFWVMNEDGVLQAFSGNTGIRVRELVGKALRTNASQTQSLDSYISSYAMALGKRININIHDANIGALDNQIDMINLQNKAAFIALASYNGQLESLKALKQTTEAMLELHEAKEIELDLSQSGAMMDALSALYRHSSAVWQNEHNKLNMLMKIETVHQYAGELGEYTVTDEDKQLVTQSRKQVDDVLGKAGGAIPKQVLSLAEKYNIEFIKPVEFVSNPRAVKPRYVMGGGKAKTHEFKAMMANIGLQYDLDDLAEPNDMEREDNQEASHAAHQWLKHNVKDYPRKGDDAFYQNNRMKVTYLSINEADAVYVSDAMYKGKDDRIYIGFKAKEIISYANKLGKPVYLYNQYENTWLGYDRVKKEFVPTHVGLTSQPAIFEGGGMNADAILALMGEVEERSEDFVSQEVNELTTPSSMQEIVNHSGGAYGADSLWDIVGREYGVTDHRHYREETNQRLSKPLRDKGVSATIISKDDLAYARQEISRLLNKHYQDDLVGNLQARNYYQVKRAEAVFAIAPLTRNEKGVTGGTNTAVQLSIKMGKPTYVWDTATRQWYKFTGVNFVPTSTPTLPKNFAGVGTRQVMAYSVRDKQTGNWVSAPYLGDDVANAARQAIAEVYQKTQSALTGTQQEPQWGKEVATGQARDVIGGVTYTQYEKGDMTFFVFSNGTVRQIPTKYIGKNISIHSDAFKELMDLYVSTDFTKTLLEKQLQLLKYSLHDVYVQFIGTDTSNLSYERLTYLEDKLPVAWSSNSSDSNTIGFNLLHSTDNYYGEVAVHELHHAYTVSAITDTTGTPHQDAANNSYFSEAFRLIDQIMYAVYHSHVVQADPYLHESVKYMGTDFHELMTVASSQEPVYELLRKIPTSYVMEYSPFTAYAHKELGVPLQASNLAEVIDILSMELASRELSKTKLAKLPEDHEIKNQLKQLTKQQKGNNLDLLRSTTESVTRNGADHYFQYSESNSSNKGREEDASQESPNSNNGGNAEDMEGVSNSELRPSVITNLTGESIYSKLDKNTASGNVVIRRVYGQQGITLAKKMQGVFSLRTKSEKHFGNPFSHEKRLAKRDNLVLVNSVKDAVTNYIDWVLAETTHIEPERHAWVRKVLQSGVLKGKPIIYYKELGEPSHANALDYLINKHDWGIDDESGNDESSQEPNTPTITNLKELQQVVQSLSNVSEVQSKLNKLLMGKANQHLKNLKVKFADVTTPDGNQAYGSYDVLSHTLTLDNSTFNQVGNDENKLRVINHELVHALTEYAIVSDAQDLKHELGYLEKMFHQVREHWLDNLFYAGGVLDTYTLESYNHLDDVMGVILSTANADKGSNKRYAGLSEFIAYGMTDPVMMKYIDDVLDLEKLGVKPKGKLSSIMDFFIRLVSQVLGFKGKNFTEFATTVEAIMDNPVDFTTLMDDTFEGIPQPLFSQNLENNGTSFNETYEEILKSPAAEVYRKVKADGLSTEWTNHLDLMVTTIYDRHYESLTSDMKTVLDESFDTLFSSNPISMTDKESAAYAAVFAVLKHIYEEGTNKHIISELNKIYEQVINQFPSVEEYASDYADAKAINDTQYMSYMENQFNEIFRDKSSDAIPKVLALILTNQQFSNKTKAKLKLREMKYDTWFDKLMNFWHRLMNFTRKKFVDADNTSEATQKLITKLVQVDAAVRLQEVNKADKIWNMTYGKAMDLANKASDAVWKLGSNKIFKAADSAVNAQKNPRVAKVVEAAKEVHQYLGEMNNHDLVPQDELTAFAKKHGITFKDQNITYGDLAKHGLSIAVEGQLALQGGDAGKTYGGNKKIKSLTRGVLKELANEMIGARGVGLVVQKVAMLANFISQQRADHKKQMLLTFERMMNNPESFTNEVKSTITRALLMSDASALLKQHSMNDALALITSHGKRQARYNYLEKQLTELVQDPEELNHMLMQVKKLGFYMVRETTVEDMVKSSEMIATSTSTRWSIPYKDMNKQVYEIVDEMVTLYALDTVEAKYSREIPKLVETERQLIEGILNTHKALVEQSKEDFKDNPLNYNKGYVPALHDTNVDVQAITLDQWDEYRAKGYKMYGEYPISQDELDNTEPRILVYNPNHHVSRYVTGALEMKDTHHKGFEALHWKKHGRQLTEVGLKRMARIHHRAKTLNAKDYNPKDYAGSNLIMVVGVDNLITHYQYEMTGKLRDELLVRNLAFDDILATMDANLYAKPEIKETQRDLAKVLIEDAKNAVTGYKKQPFHFTKIEPESEDPRIQEMLRMMPYEFRHEMELAFGKGKPMYVRTSVFNAVFGYRKYNIAEAFDKDADDMNILEELLTGFSRRLFKNEAVNVAAMIQRIIETIVSDMKDYIVIRSGVVLLGNIRANFLVLLAEGLTPRQIINHTVYAWKEGKAYRNMQAELLQAQMDLRANPNDKAKVKQLTAKIHSLQRSMQANGMHEYMQRGLMSTIVEDIEMGTETVMFRNKEQRAWDTVAEKVPQPARTALKYLTMHPDTPMHKLMAEATQFSDFAAKYALAKHTEAKARKAGKSKAEAFEMGIQAAQEVFINYDTPTSREMQTANDLGFFMFTKFLYRFQRVLARHLHNNGGHVIAQHLLVESFLPYGGILNPLGIVPNTGMSALGWFGGFGMLPWMALF